MQIPDILEIVREVRKAIDEDQADGVVIIMGTDCMEEAAFAFETLLQTDVPVVVTGAMRVATAAARKALPICSTPSVPPLRMRFPVLALSSS